MPNAKNRRREEKRVKVMVSACLMGENCKYSGGNNRNEKVLNFVSKCEVIKVCPEVLGGLPTPRLPCEIREGLVVNREGGSCTGEYVRGAKLALELAKEEQPDLVILQPRSPSCGAKQIYDGTFTKTLISGSGIFANMMKENGFTVVEPDDLTL